MDRKRLYLDAKTPQELMDFMDEYIKYGWLDSKGVEHIDTLKDFREEYHTSSLDDSMKSGLATCIEQADIIKSFFDRFGFETKIFCHRKFETDANYGKKVYMHCLVFYKDNKGTWYYFEHSNTNYKGIHKCTTLEEKLSSIIIKYRERNDIRSVTEIPYIPSGLSFKEFNEFVNNYEETQIKTR